MFVKDLTLYLYAESAIHAGASSGLGAVDMPIQRERHTQYPIIQASGVKGALRTFAMDTNKGMLDPVFGRMPDAGDTLDYAGAFSPGDARTLLFPVRAVRGVFAYVTSFDVLERFRRDTNTKMTVPQPDNDVQALVASQEALLSGTHVLLEDFSLTARHKQAVTDCADWLAENALPEKPEYEYWRGHLRKYLIVLRIEEFRDFVQYSTEVVTRTAIDRATKTVNKEKGALFTQELLPADTLLYSPVKVTDARDGSGWKASKVTDELMKLNGQTQIGGDETVGRGRVFLRWNGA